MSFWDYLILNQTQRTFKKALRSLKAKHYQEALNLINEVITRKPDYYLFHFVRGTAHQRLQKRDAALRDYDEALRLKGNHAGSHFNRGLTYYENKEFKRALDDFSAAIDLKYDAFAARALTHAEMCNTARALSDIEEAVRRKPSDAQVRLMQAMVDRRLGMIKEALADLETALNLDSECKFAHNLKAWLLATSERSEFRDGRRAVEHAIKAKGNDAHPHPGIIGTLAAAYAEAGQYEQAIQWATYFLENNPPEENVEAARRRLELYRQGKPYHEPIGTFETVRDNRLEQPN